MLEDYRIGLILLHSSFLIFYGAKDHINRKVSYANSLIVLILSMLLVQNYFVILLLGLSIILVKLMLVSGIKPSISDQYMIYSSSYSVTGFLAGLGSVLISFIVKKMNPNDKPPMWTFYAILHSISLALIILTGGNI